MKNSVKTLPNFLVKRYLNWKRSLFPEKQNLYLKLKNEGQSPTTMIISCCDSRVHPERIFVSEIGEFFVHRNVGNLVPPYSTDADYHEISSSLEYAVKNLDIENIIVLGHSNCGGIKGSIKYFSQNKKFNNFSHIDKWLEQIRPVYDNLPSDITNDEKSNILEKEAINNSLLNLITYPYIRAGVKNDKIKLHGLWFEIGTGSLMVLNQKQKIFENIIS